MVKYQTKGPQSNRLPPPTLWMRCSLICSEPAVDPVKWDNEALPGKQDQKVADDCQSLGFWAAIIAASLLVSVAARDFLDYFANAP